MKRSVLRRRTPLRSRPKRPDLNEPGRAEWKTPHGGYCTCGCDRFAMHLHLHHVVTEAHVRLAGGDPWNLANAMALHPHCHAAHHAASRRIPLPSVPDSALAFAVDLLGEDRAVEYMRRFYTPEVDGEGWRP